MTYQPYTIWIGGSYYAAAGLPEPAVPEVSLRSKVLALIVSTPGLSSKTICLMFEPISRNVTSRNLHSLKVAGAVYSIRTSVRAPGSKAAHTTNVWFPGPAPQVINHMTAGRPRKSQS